VALLEAQDRGSERVAYEDGDMIKRMARSESCTILVLVFTLAAGLLRSAEKYSIATNADLVIVGRFTDFDTVQQSRGWRLVGKLKVEESLYGRTPKGAILLFDFDCSCCRPEARRNEVMDICKRKGLWFLRRSNQGWTSAGSGCGDPGYRPLEYREDMLRFLGARRNSK
jgi:hypothetical protein